MELFVAIILILVSKCKYIFQILLRRFKLQNINSSLKIARVVI